MIEALLLAASIAAAAPCAAYDTDCEPSATPVCRGGSCEIEQFSRGDQMIFLAGCRLGPGSAAYLVHTPSAREFELWVLRRGAPPDVSTLEVGAGGATSINRTEVLPNMPPSRLSLRPY